MGELVFDFVGGDLVEDLFVVFDEVLNFMCCMVYWLNV